MFLSRNLSKTKDPIKLLYTGIEVDNGSILEKKHFVRFVICVKVIITGNFF
jgi:hypothetical protein